MSSKHLDVEIPPSEHTASVKPIKTGSFLRCPATMFLRPVAKGYENIEEIPVYAFLVEKHSPTSSSPRRVLFDAGFRYDLPNCAPMIREMVKAGGIELFCPPEGDIFEQLQKGGVSLDSIEAVFWSHTHFDHTGDMSRFPSGTELVLGPGSSRRTYPEFEDATLLESDFKGRKVIELDFGKSSLKIADLNAIDYFGDGSLFILDSPGHCLGHITALVRVTPTSFVLLGGDSCHHVGVLRPTTHFHQGYPCPLHIASAFSKSVLEDTIFEFEGSRNITDRKKPLLTLPPIGSQSVYHDREESLQTLEKLGRLDAHPDIFVLLAHDTSLEGVIGLFPESVDAWKVQGLKERVVWSFIDPESKTFRFGRKESTESSDSQS